jgi:hypothetical protein
MRSQRRVFRNVILPLMVLAPLLWLMVGCVYVPWFESRQNSSQRDFRGMLGAATSHKQIRPGLITCAGIESLLGEPPFISDDGLAIGYELRTNSSYWVYPLCFAADPADVKAYVVKFTFDRKGLLEHYYVASDDKSLGWIAYSENNLTVALSPFYEVDQVGPRLRLAAVVKAERARRPSTRP